MQYPAGTFAKIYCYIERLRDEGRKGLMNTTMYGYEPFYNAKENAGNKWNDFEVTTFFPF